MFINPIIKEVELKFRRAVEELTAYSRVHVDITVFPYEIQIIITSKIGEDTYSSAVRIHNDEVYSARFSHDVIEMYAVKTVEKMKRYISEQRVSTAINYNP